MSDSSAKLENLRLAAVNNPTEYNELAYIEAFPANFEAFYFTFYGKECCEELYDKYVEHMELLENLSHKYPDRILRIWLGVATDGHWDSDAVGALQHQLAHFAATDTRSFAEAMMKKPAAARSSIITFLADVENHLSYRDYRNASENLRNLGYDDLHEAFETAKKKRMMINDH